jgi:hypothetical protein
MIHLAQFFGGASMRWFFTLLVCAAVAFTAYVLYDLAYVQPARQAETAKDEKELNNLMGSWNCSLSVQLAQVRGELADSASNCDPDTRKTAHGYRACRLYYSFPKHPVKIDSRDIALIKTLHHCAQPNDINADSDTWMADPDCVCPQN